MDCKKCLLNVRPGEKPYVRCYGNCSGVFHTACVELKKEDLISMHSVKGMIWLCDECMDELEKWKVMPKNPNASCSVAAEIAELKTKVDALFSTLVPSSPSGHSSATIAQHSTPVSSKLPIQLASGTNTLYESSSSSYVADRSASDPQPVNNERSFAVLLTNIDTCVSESSIKQMVSRCLSASSDEECSSEEILVKRLVPKGVDCNTLDYVSFKVALHEKWRNASLMSSTWPRDIKFREFVLRSKPWRPI